MERITLGKHSKMHLYFDKGYLVEIKMSNKDYIRNTLKREIKKPVYTDGYYTGGCMHLDELPTMYDKLQHYEDIEEKYNVNEDDIEVALIVKKIIKNGFVYYEDGSGEGKYWYGFGLEFDFEKNEIVLSEEIDDDYSFKWEERARLPILDYKKTFWLKEDKSE